MEFDIDVSGEDILSKDYVICIANKDSLIKGFKMKNELLSIISSRYGQGLYRYGKSRKGKVSLKIRVYCIAVYYLFKSLNLKGRVILNICRDFYGKEKDIENNLLFLLKSKLNLGIEKISFTTLSKESNAHKYSYLMRRDIKNKMETYIHLEIEDLERFLK